MLSDPVHGPRYAELTPILYTVLDAVVVIGLDGVVVAWNAVAEKTFGWAAEEAIGQSLAERKCQTYGAAIANPRLSG